MAHTRVLSSTLDAAHADAHLATVNHSRAKQSNELHRGRRRLSRAVAALAVIVLAGGCREGLIVAPPDLPSSAEAFTAPDEYASWWQATEACAGLMGEMSRVHWFLVPSSQSFYYRGTLYDGYWWDDYHWITLASAKIDDGGIVRHEMLHDLLGRGDHPPAYFQGRCATVVTCNAVCRTGL